MAEKTTTLRSEELSCPSCISKIEAKLNSLDGVEEAEVKFSSGRIVVSHADYVTARQLVEAIAQIGYNAKPSSF